LKEQDKKLETQLRKAKRSSGVYGFYTSKFQESLDCGAKEKAARGAASKATSAHYGMTRRTVERIVKKWPEQERRLMRAASSGDGFEKFRLLAQQNEAIWIWFSREEFDKFGKLPLPDQALLAITRATAAVTELRQQVALQKMLVRNLIGQLRDLETKLKKCQMEQAVQSVSGGGGRKKKNST
jgi:hypothetical protein